MLHANQLSTPESIKEAYNLLFFDDANEPNPKPAWVRVVVWSDRGGDNSGKTEGFSLLEQFITADATPPKLPPPSLHDKYRVQIIFLLGNVVKCSPQCIFVPKAFKRAKVFNMENLFRLAIQDAQRLNKTVDVIKEALPTVEPKEGFVSHQFKNQKQPSIYWVRQTTEGFQIKIQKGDTMEDRKSTSSRMQPIVKKFVAGDYYEEK